MTIKMPKEIIQVSPTVCEVGIEGDWTKEICIYKKGEFSVWDNEKNIRFYLPPWLADGIFELIKNHQVES